MTSCTGSARGGFWGFWRKSESWVLWSEEEEWLSLARRGLECVSLSLCRRTFKLKGNKKFRTWNKKSCFSCFGIPMFYVNMLWTFYVRFTYPYLAMVLSEWGNLHLQVLIIHIDLWQYVSCRFLTRYSTCTMKVTAERNHTDLESEGKHVGVMNII